MKLIRKIHLWLSLPFGLVISVICLTGASLVFEDEITRLVQHDLYYVPAVGTQPLSPDGVEAIVAATLPDTVHVTGVQTNDDPSRSWRVGLSKPHKAAMMVDPYTGQILGRTQRLGFFDFNFKMHRWLMDVAMPGAAPSVGKRVVGYSTIAFVFILLSGVVLWVPMAVRNARANASLVLRRGRFLFWRSTHVALGGYAAVFLLLMALTGLTWSFGWYRTAFTGATGMEQKLLYTLHTGAIGGLLTKTLWFVSALIGAALPLTGYYMWLRKLLRK